MIELIEGHLKHANGIALQTIEQLANVFGTGQPIVLRIEQSKWGAHVAQIVFGRRIAAVLEAIGLRTVIEVLKVAAFGLDVE